MEGDGLRGPEWHAKEGDGAQRASRRARVGVIKAILEDQQCCSPVVDRASGMSEDEIIANASPSERAHALCKLNRGLSAKVRKIIARTCRPVQLAPRLCRDFDAMVLDEIRRLLDDKDAVATKLRGEQDAVEVRRSSNARSLGSYYNTWVQSICEVIAVVLVEGSRSALVACPIKDPVTVCPVCLEDCCEWGPPPGLRDHPDCKKHSMHHHCCLEWVNTQSQPSCPVCAKPIEVL